MADQNQPTIVSGRLELDASKVAPTVSNFVDSLNKANEQVAKNAKKTEDELVHGVEAALSRVKKARSEEIAAVRAGNEENKKYWNSQREAAEEIIQKQREMEDNTEAMTRALNDAEAGNRRYLDSIRDVSKANQAAFERKYIDQLKDAYSHLNEAHSKYIAALKSGDKDAQTYWSGKIQSSTTSVDNLKS